MTNMHKASETSTTPRFTPGIPGYSWADLHAPAKLKELAELFYKEVEEKDAALWAQFAEYRDKHGAGIPVTKVSEILIGMARYQADFVARLFGVERERATLKKFAEANSPLWRFKEFLKTSFKKLKPEDAAAMDAHALQDGVQAIVDRAFPSQKVEDDRELTIAQTACALLDLEKAYNHALGFKPPQEVPAESKAGVAALRKALEGDERFTTALAGDATLSADSNDLALVRGLLDLVARWAFAAYHHGEHSPLRQWVTLRFPKNLDWSGLVDVRRHGELTNVMDAGGHAEMRRRDGFKLTDRRYNGREILSEVDYCLYCHQRDKDSCSKGLREPKTNAIKKNPLGITLNGCPLDEKISEMHFVKREGDSLAALALVSVDNPMSPGTGHRICNDCMKACVFQKQDPVNIPQIETSALTDVLNMSWGFEIYSFLTRWNPINIRRPYALPYNGKNVMVVGLGPAGYTLAHHLLNEGFGVVAIDGLKIEPLPESLTGFGAGGRRLADPVFDFKTLQTELDSRVLGGFGGVAEYGITVRYDKNFLDVIHLNLARREKLRYFGGIRFGGTLTIEDAWEMGIDHIAIAAGAGKPTIIDIKNNLIRGIRKASDFLMGLQLSGAFKKDSLANLQVRLPALVIGGGLTGIDTTTELAAYYPVQVEKFLERHELLVSQFGEERVRRMYDDEEKGIAEEFLAHGRAVRAERERAKAAGEEPDFAKLVRSWGGVTLVYRKSMADSPAYRLNHEEIIKFLEEGVSFAEKLSPLEAVRDEFGALKAMRFEKVEEREGKWVNTGEFVELPARSVCVAAGTAPSVTYEKEYPGTFELDLKKGSFKAFRAVKGEDGTFALEPDAGGPQPGFFTSYNRDGKFITFYGDNLPRYAGSVVKAMASAKHGYSHVAALFADEIAQQDPKDQPMREHRFEVVARRFEEQLAAEVVRVERLTPTIVEVVVKAPLQAKKFKPGQFYRLQNFERLAPVVDGVKMQLEGMALTGAWTDPEKGLLSLIVLEMGGSSRLVSALKPGEPVLVMGPTGTPTEIPQNETVLLAGGGLGNAVLFSIGKALRDNGCKVLYFAGYRNSIDVYKQDEIEAASDLIIWCNDQGAAIAPRRPQDRHFAGNIVQAMVAYAEGKLGEQPVPMKDVKRIIAIGSDR
ncbi:MAG: FAD-dependent oxidoreductase, partial [Myxococcales bacterium]